MYTAHTFATPSDDKHIKRLCIKTKNLFYDDNWASGYFFQSKLNERFSIKGISIYIRNGFTSCLEINKRWKLERDAHILFHVHSTIRMRLSASQKFESHILHI